jgi:hypothetical protein
MNEKEYRKCLKEGFKPDDIKQVILGLLDGNLI